MRASTREKGRKRTGTHTTRSRRSSLPIPPPRGVHSQVRDAKKAPIRRTIEENLRGISPNWERPQAWVHNNGRRGYPAWGLERAGKRAQTEQLTGQTASLQSVDISVSGHAKPAPARGVITARLREAAPPSQLAEHGPQVVHAATMQLTAVSVGVSVVGAVVGTAVVGLSVVGAAVGVAVVGPGVLLTNVKGLPRLPSDTNTRTCAKPGESVAPAGAWHRTEVAVDHEDVWQTVGPMKAEGVSLEAKKFEP